ncbi:MAG: transposase [Gammaproteobacteria bacterium]
MPRKPRIHIPGGFYHVILRGNAQQDIFCSNNDRAIWEALVDDGLGRYGHRIHAYCWMTNHVHIAIQAGTQPLSRFMAYLASNYARRFNLRSRRTGHLFERRYRAILVNEDEYLIELVRYIHKNPVRAEMVKQCNDYEWSSHKAYMGVCQPEWLSTDFVLQMLGRTVSQARANYASFIEEPARQKIIDLLRNGSLIDDRALGSDDWLEQKNLSLHWPQDKLTLDGVIRKHCALHDMAESALHGKSRARHLARIRAEIALEAVENNIASISDIARHFGRSQPVLSRTMQRLRNKCNKL